MTFDLLGHITSFEVFFVLLIYIAGIASGFWLAQRSAKTEDRRPKTEDQRPAQPL